LSIVHDRIGRLDVDAADVRTGHDDRFERLALLVGSLGAGVLRTSPGRRAQSPMRCDAPAAPSAASDSVRGSAAGRIADPDFLKSGDFSKIPLSEQSG
jgi:hypothetical protein